MLGRVAEWFKAHAWKACVLETVPRVRISLRPYYTVTLLHFNVIGDACVSIAGGVKIPPFVFDFRVPVLKNFRK